MKFLLLLAAAATVQAEADPAFAYHTGALPLTYAHHAVYAAPAVTYAAPAVTYGHHAPLVYAAAAGCTNDAGSLVPCALGHTLGPYVVPALPAAAPAAAAAAPAVVAVERKKREAEAAPEAKAEAEADPWVFYSTHGYWPHGYSHYAPHAYSYAPFTYSGHYGYYGLGGYGYYGRKKREAEPTAEAEADPYLLYGGYGYGGFGYAAYGGHYGYGYHHSPYAYLGGCRNYLGGLVPCAGR